MLSKVEAEEKLLKIFYDVKLDSYLKKYPTHVNIDMFEETKDPNHLEHFYKVKDDELVIAMWANSYEHGIPFFAVNMAHDSAIHWREDTFSKYLYLFIIFHCILPFITLFFANYFNLYSLTGGIISNLIGTGILIYFIVSKIKWKKRVLVRFKELFKTTGVFLPEVSIFLFIISWSIIFNLG